MFPKCFSISLNIIIITPYRDEAQNKMLALKERSDKDMAQQDVEMKELHRIIKHDNKLKEFMGIKVNDRLELKEEEMIKRSKGKGRA